MQVSVFAQLSALTRNPSGGGCRKINPFEQLVSHHRINSIGGDMHQPFVSELQPRTA